MAKYYKKRWRKRGKTLEGGELKRCREKPIKIFSVAFLVLTFLFSYLYSICLSSLKFVFLVLSAASCFFAILFLAWLIVNSRRLRKYKNIEAVRDNLDPWDFERWTGNLLKKLGYKRVQVVGGENQGDGGIDVQGYSPEGDFVVIQCKKYKRQVSVDQIRDFMGAMVHFKADRGIFVTTGFYTSYCRDLEKQHPNIKLWDKNKLASLQK